MILGFAHLAINTSNFEGTTKRYQKLGYSVDSTFLNLPNNLKKNNFLTNFQEKHDILILTQESKVNLEITSHGGVYGENHQLALTEDNTKISLFTSNQSVTKKILVDGLGFKEEENSNELSLKSIIPSWSCNIILVKEDRGHTKLDYEGPSCIAFYVRNIEVAITNLVLSGAINYSGFFSLTTDKNLNVAMLKLPNGPVIELIEVIKISNGN